MFNKSVRPYGFDEITKCGDEGSPEYIIYLAFPKPFDKEPLQHMTVKCKSHGMGLSINNWIAHGLTDRKQRVVLDWMI